MSECLYKESVSAKDGSLVPLLQNGKALHSKYNPMLEADRLVQNLTGQCFLFIGIGGGFTLASCRKLYPHARIFALEKNEESLNFCRELPLVKQTLSDREIFFLTKDQLYTTLLSSYIPSLHGNLAISFNRTWEEENKNVCQEIRSTINAALKKISADFSVQAHFGKNWQHNILNNISLVKYTKPLWNENTDREKKAAVIAAGPTLDKSIIRLKENLTDYYVISTDTAFGAILSKGIIPDAVVSVDSQRVSQTHFYGKEFLQNTKYIFDISSPGQIISLLVKNNCNITFVQTGHPLSALLLEKLPHLESGSGTVAVTACDCARLMGFKTIELFGADFSYSSGKAYCSGTYLEKNFSILQNRLNTYEGQNLALMFRTELSPLNKKAAFSPEAVKPFTTEVLQNYQESLLQWAEKYGYQHKENLLISNGQKSENNTEKDICFDKESLRIFQKELSQAIENKSFTKEIYALLPYISWLKKHGQEKTADFFELVKLAQAEFLRYNRES